MYKVYKYTNLINDKIYIGQTKYSLEERAKKDGINYKGSKYFYRAIQKYDWDKFVPEILKDNLTQEEANEWEEYYIKLFDSINPLIGYNIRSGGNNSELSEEAKQIISEKAKNRYKDKTNNPMYGKSHSDETKKKMSDIKIGENNPMYGKTLSYESRKKISEHHKGKNNPIYNHVYTEEERKIISRRVLSYADKWRKKVFCIEDNLTFSSVKDASSYYHVGTSTLSGHLNGHQKSCKGKHFKFVS